MALDLLYHKPTLTYQNRMEPMFDIIRSMLSLPDKPVVLDSGSSIGISTYELASIIAGAKVIGMEIRDKSTLNSRLGLPKPFDELVEDFKAKDPSISSRVKFVQGDMFEQTYRSETFDLIVMANNLLNRIDKIGIGIRKEEIVEALVPSIKILKNKGYIVLYSNTSGYLPLQEDKPTFSRHGFILMRKVNGKMVLVGNEDFYDVHSQFSYDGLIELVDSLNI